MTGIQGGGAFKAPTRQRLLAVCGVAMVLLLGLWMTKGPVQQASAWSKDFCTGIWLQPFGHNGDRCGSGQESWARLQQVKLQTFTRAGCVNYHGWYGEYYEAWQCVGSNSWSIKQVPWDGGSYIGIIRNNNVSYGGHFNGTIVCCWP